jgi:hypothetical protein
MSYSHNPLFIVRSILKDFAHYYLPSFAQPSNDRIHGITKELSSRGYSIVPDFLSQSVCQNLRFEIDQLFNHHKDSLWRDQLGTDERFFGIENHSSSIKELFFSSALINQTLDFYEKSHSKDSLVMAGRIHFKQNNLGSGQGWHRDRSDYKQSKAILYLSDTDENNGPLQYIERSHKPHDLLSDFLKYSIDIKNTRIDEAKLEKLLQKEPERLKTFLAPAGTLIFLDTRGIHRGAPLKTGTRYALTNYNWHDQKAPSHISSLVIK